MTRASRNNATDLDLDAIWERAERATSGPWTVHRQTESVGGYGPYEYIHIPQIADLEWTPDGADCHMCGAQFSEPDAEFIANARRDIPALLAEVGRLRAKADPGVITVEQVRKGDRIRVTVPDSDLTAEYTGVAFRRDADGDWWTEGGVLLTGWSEEPETITLLHRPE